MGQLSGLYALEKLMTNKGKGVRSFSSFDVHDKTEECVDEYDLLLRDDGRTCMQWHHNRRRGAHV